MDSQTNQLLLELNQRFYHDFGRAFAATRRRVPPGMRRAAGILPQAGSWLDLGCGSGELARFLAKSGFAGRYLGLDSSAELLAEARQRLPCATEFSVEYREADLAGPGWAEGLALEAWQVISCFAVLHHLPGVELRARVLQQARLLLGEGGRLVHSVWQFQHSPKLPARIQPWERVGLSPAQVEPGDALLDWRYALPGQAEEIGLRYVHRFTRDELAGLAESCGFSVVEEYESDGAGGRLGLYQIWRGV
jgi:tRNA (uracil-5-)-methyltransferase TRM9